MQKNKFWFTFVELVVVIAIIWIIWIWGFSSFFSNEQKRTFSQELSMITQKISDLDNNIWKDISDYKLEFFKDKDFYLISTNSDYKTNLQNINFDSYTWTIKNDSDSSSYYQLNIYKNNKIVDDFVLAWTWSLKYNFSDKWDYLIKWILGWKELNNIYIKFFPWEDWTYLKYIENSLTWVIIKNNFSWNKQIIWNWNNIDKIDLLFEKNWIEQTLEIKK